MNGRGRTRAERFAETAEAIRTASAIEPDHRWRQGLRDRLVAAGYADAHIIDEAWGRLLWVDDPDGHGLWVQEARTDLYGYHLEDGRADTNDVTEATES